MLKYLVYCRKSTDDKEKQVLSIEAQVEELRQFASREKLNIIDWVIEAKTAKVPGRPKFDQVLDRIQRGEIDGIISWHPDRLARNSVDGGRLIYLLDIGHLKSLKFPTFWFENTPQGKFMLSIAFGQSKYYVDNLSVNVKRGMRQKIRRGDWPGKAPYGYINNRQNKSIQVDTRVSKIIVKAFKLYAEGRYTFTSLSKYLSGQGIVRKDGKPIAVNQIISMLQKKFYIGILEYKGCCYQGNHKCFISKSLFDRVQAVIKDKGRKNTKHRFTFNGLIKCGECGASITGETHQKHYKNTSRVAKYSYYRCTKKIKHCSQPYIPEDNLTTQFNQTIKTYSIHPDWQETIDTWLYQKTNQEKDLIKAKLDELTRKIVDIDTKLNRLLGLFLNGKIEESTYQTKHNQLFEHKKEIEDKIKKVKEKGSYWLEPFNKFINCAMLAHKIAQKKTDLDQIPLVAKNIGSNFTLRDKKFSFNPKTAYLLLATGGGAAKFDSRADSVYKFVTLTTLSLNHF